METINKLKDSLEKNLPVKRQKDYVDKKDIKDDYEFSRATYKDLIRTGVQSLDALSQLAREAESPRAFEVLSKSIKDIGDTTEKLMSLQKAKKELNKEDDDKKRQEQKLTQNNVFVGSTTELQRALLDTNKDNIVIDAEDKE